VTFRLAPPIAALVLVAAACASGATTATGAASGNLTIYGAASLKAALATVKGAYEGGHSGVTLTISTDSSSALETQIEQGAPADVFLSADSASPQKLLDKGLAGGSLTKFAGNLLSVIVPAANPAGIKTAADLARNGVKIIAAADTVPITGYAGRLVANLAKQTGYPADFAARYSANIVSKADNVAAILSTIALGEGDAGIVYLTDAQSSAQVAKIAVPDAANVRATYVGVVVKASSHEGAAQAFLAWLAGPEGQTILASFGFVPPS
jgi:molybdate transport system substrate-binding protein